MTTLSPVIAGLVPAIRVDHRDKPGDDCCSEMH
jgi:hypothetical protein